MSYLWLCLLGICIQAAFIVVERRERYVLAVVLKGCASAVFVLLGVLGAQMCASASFARCIVAGLVCGLLGDVCLNLRHIVGARGKAVFMAGVAAFLLGHILYLAALIPLAPATLVYSVPAGLVAAALLLFWLLKRIEVKGAFKIFGVVYIGAVVLMTAVAAGLFLHAPQETGLLLFTVGAVFFTASDVVLVFSLFGKNPPKALRTVNLSLYYLGQLLIALSLQWL